MKILVFGLSTSRTKPNWPKILQTEKLISTVPLFQNRIEGIWMVFISFSVTRSTCHVAWKVLVCLVM